MHFAERHGHAIVVWLMSIVGTTQSNEGGEVCLSACRKAAIDRDLGQCVEWVKDSEMLRVKRGLF